MASPDPVADPDGYRAWIADRVRRPLEAWVDELVECIVEHLGRDTIAQERAVVIERPQWANPQVEGKRSPLEDFEPRWKEIMRSVCRTWVNLAAVRVEDDGTLVLAVEWFEADGHYDIPGWPYVVTNFSWTV